MPASVINATVNGLNATGGNTAGLELQVSGTTAVTINSSGDWVLANALPVASGGTGANTLTSNNVILGNGTSAVQFVAPGTNGNVLTSNGTTWTSAAPSGGSVSLKQVVFTSNTSWTCPAGVTAVEIQIWGGGGGGGCAYTSGCCTGYGGNGGAGGYIHGTLPVTPTTSYTITIGAGGAGSNSSSGSSGGTTSFGSLISCTGGAGANSVGGNGANGSATTTNLTASSFFAFDQYPPSTGLRYIDNNNGPYSIQFTTGTGLVSYSGSTTARTVSTTSFTTPIGTGGAGERNNIGGNDSSGGVQGGIVIKYVG